MNTDRIYDGDLAAKSYHELGHAFAFRYFGYKVARVEVGEAFACTVLPEQTVNAFDYIVALHCGKAAVDKWFGWRTPGGKDQSWRESRDYKRAYKAALRVSFDDKSAANALMRWAAKAAEALIEKHWHSFHEPARVLSQMRKLDVA